MKFKGYGWQELLDAWNISVDHKELPEFDGDGPDYNKMKNYRTEDGCYSWSAWWDAEASDEYKAHIKELGKVNGENEKADMNAITKYMFDSLSNGTSDKVASELRSFIQMLHRESVRIDYMHPVWSGLLKVEDNDTLFRLTSLLLPAMWT